MKRWTYPLLAGLAILAFTGCSDDSDADSAGSATATAQTMQTFDIENGVTGSTENANRAAQSCEFYDGWLRPGDPVIVRGADGTILGKSELVFESLSNAPAGVANICTFGFTMQGVKAGEPAYELTVGDLEPLIQTQQELQSYYYYSARNAVNALAGETDELIGRTS